MEPPRRRRYWLLDAPPATRAAAAVFLSCICFCFFSVSALPAGIRSETSSSDIADTRSSLQEPYTRSRQYSYSTHQSQHQQPRRKMMSPATPSAATERRYVLLSGPGSSPPRCTSKCGRCTPCRPVHVAVPPGTPVIAEYYPEAWRCKCGNRLYMP